jgi:hypothetical protein
MPRSGCSPEARVRPRVIVGQRCVCHDAEMPEGFAAASIPDWVTGILAVIAAVSTSFAWVFNRKSRKLAKELETRQAELDIKKQELDTAVTAAQAFDLLSDQARQVTVAVIEAEDGTRTYQLVNDSDNAIKYVQAKTASSTGPHAAHVHAIPAKSRWNLVGAVRSLRFQDHRGHWWYRDAYETLKMLPDDFQPKTHIDVEEIVD